MGKSGFALITFGVIAVYYNGNNLWSRIWQNQWVILFCLYISLSFVYGLWRFRTPGAAIFDLWFFALIPAVLLIPPFSFNARVFDRLMAICVVLSVCSTALALIVFPDALYDRVLFGDYVASLSLLGVGAAYLLLKYAERPNAYTLIGMIGVVTDGVAYGIGGAFRGRLILAILLLLLFVLIVLFSRRAKSHVKLLAVGGVAVAVTLAGFFVVTQFGDQLDMVLTRFTGLQLRYENTGDLAAADSRMLEVQYFRQLNSDWKLILGHGVGALWYDYFGMYQITEAGGLEGARTMLHLNWMNLLFKIGLVGFILLIGMLVAHFRKNRQLILHNWGWWAFVIYYCAWTTYYGDKELGFRSVIFLIVLIHPWLFRIPLIEGGAKPDAAKRQSAGRPRQLPPESRVFSGGGSR